MLVFPPDCTFQSTPSTRRETVQPILHWVRQVNFNPLPPHGGRLLANRNLVAFYHFNPLPPHGGRLCHFYHSFLIFYISIHSLHTEGDLRHRRERRLDNISIHSLHTEGDGVVFSVAIDAVISIHSLHTEGDPGTRL